MQKARTDLRRERTLLCGGADLVHQRTISPREKFILHHRVVPPELAKVVERRELRQVDVLHHGKNIQQARDAGAFLLHELFVTGLRLRLTDGSLHEELYIFRMRLLQDVPLSLREIPSGAARQEHKEKSSNDFRRYIHRMKSRLNVSVR